MEQTIQRQSLFSGLVFGDDGEPLAVTYIGNEPHYIFMDAGFKRHIPTETVDRQVVEWMRDQALANKEMVTENIMGMLGKDDLFTKAQIDSSIGNMEQVMNYGLPEDTRMMLGMMGFKITVNVHGEIVDLKLPEQAIDEADIW